MKTPKLLLRAHACACVLILITVSSQIFAQSKKKTRADKDAAKSAAAAQKAAPTPATAVITDSDPIWVYDYVSKADLSAAKDSDMLYASISIPLTISGAPPPADYSVSFNIENKTPANAQFVSAGKFDSTIQIPVAKDSFNADGSPKQIKSVPVIIRFKKVSKGQAYITIVGKQNVFFQIAFTANSPTGKLATPVKTVKPAPLSATADKYIVQLMYNSTTIKDTIKAGAIDSISALVSLDLSKGKGKKMDVKLLVKEGSGSTAIKAVTTEQTITIDDIDWNPNQDTIVQKLVEIYIKQVSAATSDQYLLLSLDGLDGQHKIILSPPPAKTTPKNNLVSFGDAELKSTKVGISHYLSNNVNSIDSINVKVKIYGKYNSSRNALSFGFLDTAVAKHFKIWPSPDTITRREWDEALVKYHQKHQAASDTVAIGYLKVPLKIKTVGLNDSLNDAQYIDLILNGQGHIKGGSQKIKLSIKDQPFWAEVGANFDQLDNIKPNNLYVGVYMFDKDRGRIVKNNDLSFTGGVYESQSQSVSSSSNTKFRFKGSTSPVLDSSGKITSYTSTLDTGLLTSTTSVKRVGLFFSPHLKLTNGRSDENGIHVYFSLYGEMLWQRITTNIDYSKQKTVYTVSDTTPAFDATASDKIPSVSFDFRSHYLGLGIPIYIKESDFNLYLNMVAGKTNQQFALVSNETGADINPNNWRGVVAPPYNDVINFMRPKNGWNSFYIVQYRLNEVRYGITFSGEVRSLFIPGSKPVITLALSKKFDLRALLKPIVAPFGK